MAANLSLLFSFQCNSDKSECTTIAQGSIKTDTDNLHDDDTLTSADLMAFAWQTAKGMVRTGLRACYVMITSSFPKMKR